jgi:glutamyl-tRNA reductase
MSCENHEIGYDNVVFRLAVGPHIDHCQSILLEAPVKDFEIASASYAYPAVPSDDRAQLATSLGPVSTALTRLREAGIPSFILATCLRIEIAVPGPLERLDDALQILFGDVPKPRGTVHRSGAEAVEHLFRIVSGLESPVVGEREILVQFRHAALDAAKHGGANGTFVGLFDAAIATARSVREELPADPRRSMAAVAAGLTVGADRVAVFGHGEMGRSVAEALLSLPHSPTVEVYVRRPELIASQQVIIRPLTEAPSALVTMPAVISATSAKTRLIPADELAALLAARSEPLIMVDMAMPPDFAPPAGAAVEYHDIDHLATLAKEHMPKGRADEIVSHAAEEFLHKIWAGRRTGHLIEHLFDQADEAVNEVVERLAGKLTSPEDRALLEQAARTAARKVLHRPVHYLAGDGTGDAAAIAAAFGVGLDD